MTKVVFDTWEKFWYSILAAHPMHRRASRAAGGPKAVTSFHSPFVQRLHRPRPDSFQGALFLRRTILYLTNTPAASGKAAVPSEENQTFFVKSVAKTAAVEYNKANEANRSAHQSDKGGPYGNL
ncbi:MAG: hypothetical protein LUC47_00415 [Clostridiales bacterium]|nr:hypothetical protein [Clostridiales bacterium]